MNTLKQIAAGYNRISLIGRIAAGIVIGVILALVIPGAEWIGILGDMFVGALKAIAPVLVAILVMSALCQGKGKLDRRFGLVIFYYLLSTFLAAAAAVAASFLFPQTLVLATDVAGGSLLLIPMACSLFGISPDVAMQVVGVGFIIGVIQDSVETALNSSGDVMFAATAEYVSWKKQGRELPEIVGGMKKL